MLVRTKFQALVLTLGIAGTLALALAPSPAEAGVRFQYLGSGPRSADVFGYIEFDDAVSAAIGNTWVLGDVSSFSLNHGAFSYSSATDPGFLENGPGQFGANTPFANFDILSNPVQLANDALSLGDTLIVVHDTASALLVSDLNTGISFSDPVMISWSRVQQVEEPGTVGLLAFVLAALGFSRRLRRSS